MTELYLIRHGETPYNRNGQYQGQADIALSDEGRRQSEALRMHMIKVQLDAIYASNLQRAQLTAEIMAAGRPVLLEPRLREINVGRLSGLTTQQVAEQEPDFWQAYKKEPDTTPFPGGEHALEVQARVLEAVTAIASRFPNGSVAIVTHGGVIKALVAQLLGITGRQQNKLVFNNCGISLIEWGLSRRRIRSLNETGHLFSVPCAVKADF